LQKSENAHFQGYSEIFTNDSILDSNRARAGSAVIQVNIKGDTSAAEVADAFYQMRKNPATSPANCPWVCWGLF
jgi:hypothetical protein